MKMTQVPILITWDIDPNACFTVAQKRESLQAALNLCRESGIAATFFFVAQEAILYPSQIAEMKQAGHTIGCHGLIHGDDEEYIRMTREEQRAHIEQATRLLEEVAAVPIQVFRSPRVKVSSVTLELLAECGYLADSSVCSQRLDLLSSNPINVGWLTAPRLPYHPNRNSAFRPGDLGILEIPISALMLPFISTTMYILGLRVAKALFRILYIEARRRGKPIVYLAHPEEFGPQSWPVFRWSDLSLKSLRTHGLMIRKHWNESDPESRLQMNRALFSYMATFPDVHFVTMREYILQGDWS